MQDIKSSTLTAKKRRSPAPLWFHLAKNKPTMKETCKTIPLFSNEGNKTKENNGTNQAKTDLRKQRHYGQCMFTWVSIDQHGSAAKVACSTISLVLLPVTVESIGGVSNHSVRIIAVSLWRNLHAISTTLSTSVVHSLLQGIFRNTRLSHTPHLLNRENLGIRWAIV